MLVGTYIKQRTNNEQTTVMAGYDNIRNKGFDKFPEHRGNGRKKKIYTVLKEKGYSAGDIRSAFGELAFYTLAELKEVHADEEKPVIARIVANQFYKALKDSDWGKVKEILEHVIGRPQQKMEVTSHTPQLILKTKAASQKKIEELGND